MRAALAGFLGAISACAQNAPLDTLAPAGPDARKILGLFTPVFAVAVLVFIVVQGLIVYAVFRFRHRDNDPMPVQTHGNTKLEITWTLIPALILAVISVPTVATIFALAKEKPDSVQVSVIGHQWWWEYQYTEENVVTANELHIPAGRSVFLKLTSKEDLAVVKADIDDPSVLSNGVIHSFWVPKLAGKQDVVPGRTNTMRIEADEPGVYRGTCAEFCGLSHANMRLRVIAHTPEDYEAWLDSQRAPPAEPSGGLAAAGKKEFQAAGCAGCHTIQGFSEGRAAPNLTHFAGRTTFAGSIFPNTPGRLEAWLRDPPGVKPGSRMPNLNLTQAQIDSLVAYLRSLK